MTSCGSSGNPARMAYDTRIVGQAVERVRVRVGISVNAWAQKAGVGEATIRDIISGQTRSTRLSTVYKLAESINVPVWELLGEDVPWKREYEELRAILEGLYAHEEERTKALREAFLQIRESKPPSAGS